MFAADIALSGLICSFETVILYFPLWFAISTSFTAEGLIGYHWVINHFQLIFHFHGWDDMHHDSLVFSGSLLCRFATSLVRRNGWDLVTSVRLTTCGRTWPPVVLLQGMLSFRGYWYTYDIIWSYFFSNSPKVALAWHRFLHVFQSGEHLRSDEAPGWKQMPLQGGPAFQNGMTWSLCDIPQRWNHPSGQTRLNSTEVSGASSPALMLQILIQVDEWFSFAFILYSV